MNHSDFLHCLFNFSKRCKIDVKENENLEYIKDTMRKDTLEFGDFLPLVFLALNPEFNTMLRGLGYNNSGSFFKQIRGKLVFDSTDPEELEVLISFLESLLDLSSNGDNVLVLKEFDISSGDQIRSVIQEVLNIQEKQFKRSS